MAKEKTAEQNTSLVKNTAGRVDLKGNAAAKGGANKKGGASANKKGGANKQNPAYQRNTAAVMASSIITPFVIALVINLFDATVSRLIPQASTFWRTVGKFGTGWALGNWGGKWSVTRSIAPTLRNALYIAGALDVVATYAMPPILTFIDSMTAKYLPSPIPANQLPAGSTAVGTATNPATGQLGQVVRMSNGQLAQVYDTRQQVLGYNPANYNPVWQARNNRQIARVW